LGDKVYTMGGLDGRNIKLDDTWILDLKTFEWTEFTPSGPAPGIRWRHSPYLRISLFWLEDGYQK
jgi:hypothetical protein